MEQLVEGLEQRIDQMIVGHLFLESKAHLGFLRRLTDQFKRVLTGQKVGKFKYQKNRECNRLKHI